MTNQNIENENQRVLVFSAKQIERLELDTDDDWRDLISLKLKSEDYKELYAGWDAKDRYYVVVVQI
jgi:hypothetical protein